MNKYSISVLLLALAAPAAALDLQGHRGSRGTHPENTLPAFEEALRAGVDTLEFDLGVTKDGAVVISHDQHINPVICLGPDGKTITESPLINTLTLGEVKAYDCGALKNPRFPKQVPAPGTRVPTLDEVFEFVKTSPLPAAKIVNFNIETKIVPALPGNSPAPAAFAKAVVDIVKKHGLEDRVTVQSFDWRTLAETAKLSKKIKRAQLVSDNLVGMAGAAQAGKAHIISPDFLWMTRETVAEAHKAGLKVIPWTLNEPAAWQHALDCGADGIITDYPADLAAFLKEKGLR